MIQPKTFSFQQMLRRTIFKPRPHFFNSEDLNKQFEIIQKFVENFNQNTLIKSDIQFTVGVFSETLSGENVERSVNVSWNTCYIETKGVRFSLPASFISYESNYPIPTEGIPKPPLYVVLYGDLDTVTYADDTALCGVQSDQYPMSVPSVDVEQYTNVGITLSENPNEIGNKIAILGVFHSRYTPERDELPYGFVYYTMNNNSFKYSQENMTETELYNNGSLFEYLVNKLRFKFGKLLNETQLVRKFNLADLTSFDDARSNIGLSNVINHRQLVQAENLRDLPNKENARFHLGLGSSATKNVGTKSSEVAPGVAMPIGAILIWSGSHASIPEGWKLCDGQNGTPNLSGRFVVGYSSTDSDFNLVNKVGGGKNVTLQANNLPNHTHEVNDPGHIHDFQLNTEKVGTGNQNGLSRQHVDSGEYRGKTKNTTTGITIKNSGGKEVPDAINTLPPYYTLCYIMYVGVNIPPAPQSVNQSELTYPNYSQPSEHTDGGFPNFTPPAGSQVTMGAGIVVTNPEY